MTSHAESNNKRPKRQNENTANKIGSSTNQKSVMNAASKNTGSIRENTEFATVDNIQDESLPNTRSRSTRRAKNPENAESMTSHAESNNKRPKRPNENTANKIGSSTNQKSVMNAASINTESIQRNNHWYKRHSSGYIVRNDAFFERERKKREDEKDNGQENSKRSESTQNSDIQITQRLTKPDAPKVYRIFKSRNIPETRNEIGNNIDNNLDRKSTSSITITPIRTIQSENLPITSSNQKSKNNAASINTGSIRENTEFATLDNIQDESLPNTRSRSTRRSSRLNPQIPTFSKDVDDNNNKRFLKPK